MSKTRVVMATDYDKPFCFECKRFQIESATRDWSEITPGDPAMITCDAGHYWRVLEWTCARVTRQVFYDLIRRARSCEDFELDEELKRDMEGDR